MKIYSAKSRGTGIERFIGKGVWVYKKNMLFGDFYVRVNGITDDGYYVINKVPAKLINNLDAVIDEDLIIDMGYSMGFYHTFTAADTEQDIRDYIKDFFLNHVFYYNGALKPDMPISIISNEELIDRINSLPVRL